MDKLIRIKEAYELMVKALRKFQEDKKHFNRFAD